MAGVTRPLVAGRSTFYLSVTPVLIVMVQADLGQVSQLVTSLQYIVSYKLYFFEIPCYTFRCVRIWFLNVQISDRAG